MTFSGKTPNRAECARRDAIHAGHCMACLQRDINVKGQFLVEWHHLQGKKKHMLTIGLCCWHHRAVPFFGCSHQEMRDHYGPSLAEGSKPFHAEFGSDDELLAGQNLLLGVS